MRECLYIPDLRKSTGSDYANGLVSDVIYRLRGRLFAHLNRTEAPRHWRCGSYCRSLGQCYLELQASVRRAFNLYYDGDCSLSSLLFYFNRCQSHLGHLQNVTLDYT